MKLKSVSILNFLIACFVALIPAICSGQAGTEVGRDGIVEKLVGDWKGEGKAFGMSSKVEMKWERVLSNKFVRLQYKTEMQSAKGEAEVFEGVGFYKFLGNDKYQGTWFDSTGDRHPIDAIFADGALTSNWGTPETKLGRTIYHLIGLDQLEVIDSIRQKDGAWKEFSRATLRKQKE